MNISRNTGSIVISFQSDRNDVDLSAYWSRLFGLIKSAILINGINKFSKVTKLNFFFIICFIQTFMITIYNITVLPSTSLQVMSMSAKHRSNANVVRGVLMSNLENHLIREKRHLQNSQIVQSGKKQIQTVCQNIATNKNHDQ